MPIRNPFRKPATNSADADNEYDVHDATLRDLKNGAVEGARAIDIPGPPEYKLSEINDSGVYLPPSPPESKRSFWQSRSNTSTTSSSKPRSVFNEAEPFNMSRESFDSFRRSFDISARSPVPSEYSVPARQSLDSRRRDSPATSAAAPRSMVARLGARQSLDRPDAPLDEGFEDVKLTEENRPRKKGLFGFGGAAQPPKPLSDVEKPHHFFTGRKRGQSGGGSELKAMGDVNGRPNSRAGVSRQSEQAAVGDGGGAE